MDKNNILNNFNFTINKKLISNLITTSNIQPNNSVNNINDLNDKNRTGLLITNSDNFIQQISQSSSSSSPSSSNNNQITDYSNLKALIINDFQEQQQTQNNLITSQIIENRSLLSNDNQFNEKETFKIKDKKQSLSSRQQQEETMSLTKSIKSKKISSQLGLTQSEKKDLESNIDTLNSSSLSNNIHFKLNQANNKLAKNKKTKGRVKIKMEFIENKIKRYTTFSKRKTGIMKKAYELSTLTGTQVMLLVASETGHVYTFATEKLQPMITSEAGKNLIQSCLSNNDDESNAQNSDNKLCIENYNNDDDFDDDEDEDDDVEYLDENECEDNFLNDSQEESDSPMNQNETEPNSDKKNSNQKGKRKLNKANNKQEIKNSKKFKNQIQNSENFNETNNQFTLTSSIDQFLNNNLLNNQQILTSDNSTHIRNSIPYTNSNTNNKNQNSNIKV